VSLIHRVVFDTNILFSAVGWMGNPYRCVQAAREGRCLSITCEFILAELDEKLRLKRGMSATEAAAVIGEIQAFSQVVPLPGKLKIVADDPDDDPVVECALVSQAGYILSGDGHLLVLKQYGQIQIITAAEFLALGVKG
jgi:uncharacterized protein